MAVRPDNGVGLEVGSVRSGAMVLIPGGEFDRGDPSGVGYQDERPVRRCRVDAFLMDRTEVTWQLWEEVFHWGLSHGYRFDETYDFHPDRSRQHPVCFVSWHDAVKWCNARSEREGLTPAYYRDRAKSEVLRFGERELTEAMVRWDADGYRLPTETEWEWAARGGLDHQHYPWPSEGPDFEVHLTGERANYWESGDFWESDADCATSPVGHFAEVEVDQGGANGYGLLDMAGNVSEWCWDWYQDRWYEDPASGVANSRGPEWGYGRVLRGGSWISSPKYCRVSARYMSAADYRCHCYGLRCVATASGAELRRQGPR